MRIRPTSLWALIALVTFSFSTPALWAKSKKKAPAAEDVAVEVVEPQMTLEQTASIYHAYPVVEGEVVAVPEGYAPFYVSHYGRHGSRWITDDARYLQVINTLDSAYMLGGLTERGKELRQRLVPIWEDARGKAGCLTPKGQKQHRGIAQRMYERSPQVFNDSANVKAVASTSGRCIMSMQSFLDAMKEQNPRLQFETTSYPKDMAFISYVSPEGKIFSAEDAPWRDAHWEYVHSIIHPERLVSEIFVNPDDFDRHDKYHFMIGLYWITADIQNTTLENCELYDFFTFEELEALWRTINSRMYVCNGDSPLANGVMIHCADQLLENIIENADNAIALNANTPGQTSADLRFGHDTQLLRLLTLMQVKGASEPADNYEDMHLKWKDYTLAPMAANLQLHFYNKEEGTCGANDTESPETPLVLLLLNESVIEIPVETDCAPFYRWDKVKDFWQSRLENSLRL